MKKAIFVCLLTVVCASGLPAQTPSPTPTPTSAAPASGAYVRPNAEKRFKRFLWSTFGPFSVAGNAAGAGIGTAFNTPEEWGGKWKGFEKRFASNFGANVVRNAMIYSLDEALKVDSHFYRSTKRDVGSRFSNAVVSTFTARKPNGKRVVGVPRIVGFYASTIIAYETWYPKRYDWKDGAAAATVGLGLNAVYNLFTEFVLKK